MNPNDIYNISENYDICKFATKYLLNLYGIYTSKVSTTFLPDIYGSL
jgi:hypothetical protein